MKNKTNDFTKRVITIIQNIPPGKVAAYGSIAAAAGNPRGARQVSRVLHSMSKKYALPWHRVINAAGKISLPSPDDYERQKKLLEQEGVLFSHDDSVDLERFHWNISALSEKPL
ncbi:MAG: MGMT family protein [bacterium]|nr:MGMT family protein [bacterium]